MNDVHLVPANVKFERGVGNSEAIAIGGATRWDQLEEFIECRRCGRVGYRAEIQTTIIHLSMRSHF